MATPILLAALGELLVEESGVDQYRDRGRDAVRARSSRWPARTSAAATLLGLAAGIAAGVAINAICSRCWWSISRSTRWSREPRSDILALGITGVFYRRFFGITGKAFMVTPMARIDFGPLARIPILGAALFHHNAFVYLTFALVPVIGFVVWRTHYGLMLRAAGERPDAADALGLGVYRLRWHALLAAGVLTGLSGAYLTLAYANTFVENISGGRGYVALAVVILGRWNPWGIAAASVLFGAAMALQFGLQALGTTIPYQLFLALPYALTLVVLAGVGGQAASPSALGEPYRRP